MKYYPSHESATLMANVAAELSAMLIAKGYPFRLATDGASVESMLIYLPSGRGLHLVPQVLFGDSSALMAESAEGKWAALPVKPIGYDGSWENVYEDPSLYEESCCGNSYVLDILEELEEELLAD